MEVIVQSGVAESHPGRVRAACGAFFALALVASLAACSTATPMASIAPSGGGASTRISVSGAVLRPGTFDLAALRALPPVTRTVGTTAYTGVSLWDFLNTTVGLKTDPAVKNQTLRMVAVVTGSDGYKAAFSIAELDPSFGNQPDLIAYAAGGAPLAANGFARLIVPNDVKGGRYVARLSTIEVFAADR
jgi:DMSO/TMAO reductase YedYZ molybdopterin-dependent catalytic subunit